MEYVCPPVHKLFVIVQGEDKNNEDSKQVDLVDFWLNYITFFT